MTLTQFLQALSFATNELEEADTHIPGDPIKLYSHDKYFCPITAVCYVNTGEHYRTSDYIKAALRLGLRQSLAMKIAYAADTRNNAETNKLRTQLLDAIGLDNDVQP